MAGEILEFKRKTPSNASSAELTERCIRLRKALGALNQAILVLNRVDCNDSTKTKRESQLRAIMAPIRAELDCITIVLESKNKG